MKIVPFSGRKYNLYCIRTYNIYFKYFYLLVGQINFEISVSIKKSEIISHGKYEHGTMVFSFSSHLNIKSKWW